MNRKNGTKEKILQVAKHSFYERGYSATTYAILAKELKTSPGSFSYHFTSKAQLAGMVYTNILSDLSVLAQNKYLPQNFDVALHYALVCRLLTYALANDSNFLRFYYEFGRDDIVVARDYTVLKIVEPELITNQKDIELVYTMTKGLSWLSNITFLTQDIDCNYDYYDDYILKIKLQILNLDNKKIEDIIIKSRELIKNNPLNIKPYFNFK